MKNAISLTALMTFVLAGRDAIRGDYLRMTEGGRDTLSDQRTDISRRLDSLETDLNRFR